ncbi:hypothetical protein K435DRAFT_809724 [Dendrothele bispora CBS 962.96]|uniref:Uncharacterized protein n=1 Tax=Dendrothele bispora (strain CBS 962.96) TaxID=1314807 RepID=A0A4V4HBT6_DENBC|nr:hypothetical protein K435DRAFT_809724 [Dendrothele bispora CBS 962.96]
MPNFLPALVRFTATVLGHLAFAGIALLRLLTIYNKVQEGPQDKDVAAIVLVETRKSRKLTSIIILTTLLSHYAQLKYLTAAAWLAFLVLLSGIITAICDRILPDNFHTIRPLRHFVPFLPSVPGFSMHIVLAAEVVRVSGNVVVIVCQTVVFMGLGLLTWCLKRPERREEHGSKSAEEASSINERRKARGTDNNIRSNTTATES